MPLTFPTRTMAEFLVCGVVEARRVYEKESCAINDGYGTALDINLKLLL